MLEYYTIIQSYYNTVKKYYYIILSACHTIGYIGLNHDFPWSCPVHCFILCPLSYPLVPCPFPCPVLSYPLLSGCIRFQRERHV